VADGNRAGGEKGRNSAAAGDRAGHVFVYWVAAVKLNQPKRKPFFCLTKKPQKDLAPLRVCVTPTVAHQKIKVFLLLFVHKKKYLLCGALHNCATQHETKYYNRDKRTVYSHARGLRDNRTLAKTS
jgi:hypothetical protein